MNMDPPNHQIGILNLAEHSLPPQIWVNRVSTGCLLMFDHEGTSSFQSTCQTLVNPSQDYGQLGMGFEVMKSRDFCMSRGCI